MLDGFKRIGFFVSAPDEIKKPPAKALIGLIDLS
jgi:hypothetical protein